MSAPLLTLALDLPVSTLVLGQLLESRKIDVLKLGLWSMLHNPDDSTRTYAAFAKALCPRLNIPIFWDFKLADTPDTNARVIKRLPNGGYVTISTTLYSSTHLTEMVELCNQQGVHPVAVPLTTATEKHPLLLQVTRDGFMLSEMARAVECGFSHVVCDGSILSRLQSSGIKTHVPGIRTTAHSDANNHRYVISPSDAARLGVHNAIVGRAILAQKEETDMMPALEDIHRQLHSTQATT